MTAQRAEQLRDVDVLTRSVEHIFRNVVRLLVGKISLVRVQSILREIFVQEAEARLRAERPGRNVPLSRLALLTGLDTRTLIRIRGDMAASHAAGGRRIRISDLSSEAKVVEMWAQNPRFRDPRTGQPRPLTFGDKDTEFEQLVREVITARGVTVQSILERLEATNSVEVDREAGVLTLVTDRFSPFNSDDEASLMNNGLQAIHNLTGTIARNIGGAKQDRLIQRELWTFRLDPSRREAFRATVREFLLGVESDAEALMSPMESEFDSSDQLTAGLGFYYFEEDA